MKSRFRFDKKVQAFTLVELLVVISIIALLLAIMMPSLQKAREGAKRIICDSNLHNIFLAHNFYAEDHKDTYLDAYNPNSSQYWTRDIAFLIGGIKGTLPGTTYAPDKKKLNTYVSNNYEVFKCPSDKGMSGQAFNTYGKTAWFQYGVCYAYNGYGNDYKDYYLNFSEGRRHPKRRGLAGNKRGSIKNTAKIIMEGDMLMHTFVSGHTDYQYAWHSKAKNMANIVFVDGHVNYIEITYNPADPDSMQEGKNFKFTTDN